MLFSITPDTKRSDVFLLCFRLLDQFNFVTGIDINKPTGFTGTHIAMHS